MMRAETTGEFGLALRWINVPTLVLVVSLVGFVRLYLRAGRLWLAWAVCGLRTLSLILNFVFTPNINYRQITALGHIQFLGESVSVAEGVLNPWMLIGQASLLLLLIFVVDAAFSAWRRGDRRRALLLGVPLGFLMVAGTGQLVLVVWHIVQMPITVSLFFLGIVAAMAYEMSCETLRAVQLSDDLRDSEERFRHAAETVGEFLWEVDRAGRFTYASRSVERILGYTPEELVGKKHFYDLFLPSDREELKAAVFQMFADRQTFRGFANSNVSKSGQIVFLETSCTPVLDPAGKLVGYCGADLDVTDRKRTEQALDQQRNELTRLSRHAAASELSGALAHELNTPLAIILSNAQAAQRLLAQAPPDVAEARAILTDIVCADQRAGEVIRGMRSLIERGEICLQPLNVNEVVEEALQLARSESQRARHHGPSHVGRERAASSGRPHPTPASAAQSNLQCLRGHGRQSARRPASDAGDGDPRRRGARFRFGHRRRSAAGGCGTRFRTVLHHQKRGPGPGAGHLPFHRRGAQWPVVGENAGGGRATRPPPQLQAAARRFIWNCRRWGK